MKKENVILPPGNNTAREKLTGSFVYRDRAHYIAQAGLELGKPPPQAPQEEERIL